MSHNSLRSKTKTANVAKCKIGKIAPSLYVIMLINQPLCEERAAIYGAEKDTIKKRNGKIVTFYRKEISNRSWISAGWALHWWWINDESTLLIDISYSQLFYTGSIKSWSSNQRDKRQVTEWVSSDVWNYMLN